VVSAEKKTLIVVSILRGEVTMAEGARREGVSQTSIVNGVTGSFLAVRLPWRLVVMAARVVRPDLTAEIEELTSALGGAHTELRLWRTKGTLSPATRSSRRRGELRG